MIINKLKNLIGNMGSDSNIYEYDVINEKNINEVIETLKHDYLYPSYADIDYHIGADNYKIIEDFEYTFDFNDYNGKEEWAYYEETIKQLDKIVNSKDFQKLDYIILENNNSDFYVLRIIILKEV